MTTKKTKTFGIRLPVKFSLTADQIKTLVIKGKELFRLANFTTAAKIYLAENKDLAEVIENW